jgi:glycosyltransferase involved in cell wall biosynthesis
VRKSVIPISVVIPCFNCAETINRAVASILKQTSMPREIILVDDASLDMTFLVLNDLALSNPSWVKVLQLNTNKGAGSARNAGWAIASQPYIAFLDADDSWHFDKLRIQYEYMQDHPNVALSGHQCVLVHSNDNLPTFPRQVHIAKINVRSLLYKNPFSTPTVVLKRDIPFRFQEDKRYAEDFYLWQEIAFAGLQIVRIELPLAFVHKSLYGESGLSSKLWEMERGELSNFGALYRAGSMNYFLFMTATWFSIVKFVKRLIVASIRRVASIW